MWYQDLYAQNQSASPVQVQYQHTDEFQGYAAHQRAFLTHSRKGSGYNTYGGGYGQDSFSRTQPSALLAVGRQATRPIMRTAMAEHNDKPLPYLLRSVSHHHPLKKSDKTRRDAVPHAPPSASHDRSIRRADGTSRTVQEPLAILYVRTAP